MAITGFLCVERGVTFQIDTSDDHDGFLFDYAIIGPMKNKCEAYQSVARVFGNVGSFKDYKPVTVFSTTEMFAQIKEQEETACHVAKLVHLEGLESVDHDVLKRAASYAEDQKWKLTLAECGSFGEARGLEKVHVVAPAIVAEKKLPFNKLIVVAPDTEPKTLCARP
jgi:hypothetical protein